MRGLMQLSIIAALIGSVACYPSDEAVHWNGPDKPFSNSVENPEYMYPVTPLPASSAREAEKGRALLSALNAGHTAQAKYTTLQQASRQGWRTQVEPNFNIAGLGLEDAFESLGISSSASSWTKIEHKHSQTGISEDGSTSYPPTNAVLSNVFNPRDGAIVTYSKIEPQEAQKQQDLPISRHELVALRTSQDMTYLAWTVLAKGDQERTNLRHIFKHDIQDERALARMKNLIDWKKYPANDQSFPTPPKWPGIEISLDKFPDQGAVVLNQFRDVVDLLLTHADKKALGHRVIDKIHLFGCPKILPNSEEGLQYCVYFHVKQKSA